MTDTKELVTLAHQLEQTALNKGFHGSALYEARSLPGMTYDDKIVLSRWLRGVQRGADHIALQDIAVKIRKMGESK